MSSKEVEPALEHSERNTVATIMAGTCAVGPLDCSLVEFLRGLKYFMDEESRGFRCDTHLLNLLRRAACVAWELERDWNARAPADSAGAMVGRTLCSELIHIAAELARGEGFFSTCAEDMNPRLKRTDILKTAEDQERRLKDWAYRVRLVANKLMTAAASPAPKEEEARKAAQEIADYVSDGILGMGNEVTEANAAKFLEIISRHFPTAESAGKENGLVDELMADTIS